MIKTRSFFFWLAICGFTVLFFSFNDGPALAQYPNRPITLIVPQTPGGQLDANARILANLAQKAAGQPIVIENKHGASHTIGTASLANSKPDGYTLGFIPFVALVVTPYKIKVSYSYKDFTPVVLANYTQGGLCVRADAPYNTFKEFIDYAKNHPGLVFGHPGVGGTAQMTATYMFKSEGVKVRDMPFEGSAAACTALLGGHIAAVSSMGGHMPFVRDGKFKLLVAYQSERLQQFPNVPTLGELGFDKIPPATPQGFFAPKGIPEAVRQKAEKFFGDAVRSKTYEEFSEKNFAKTTSLSGADAEKLVEEQYLGWGRILKELGI